jgi:hypothetical protein
MESNSIKKHGKRRRQPPSLIADVGAMAVKKLRRAKEYRRQQSVE